MQRRSTLAHRASYAIHNGGVPQGAHVLHRCDVPQCVNPAHLYLGDHLRNMADRNERGRARGGDLRGSDCPWAKLTPETVRAIRADDRPGSVAAADYGINKGTFYKIKRRERWAHV